MNEIDRIQLPDGTTHQLKGTKVVANPTLAGGESELTGLEVAGTKYKMPQGGGGGGTKLYKHTLLDKDGRVYICSIISTDNTEIKTFYELDFCLYRLNPYDASHSSIQWRTISSVFYQVGDTSIKYLINVLYYDSIESAIFAIDPTTTTIKKIPLKPFFENKEFKDVVTEL